MRALSEGPSLNAPFDPRDRTRARRRVPSICPGLQAKAASIADGLARDGFAVTPDFVTPEFVRDLHTESMALRTTGGFRPAGIGRGATWTLRPDLRSDEIQWIDPVRATRLQKRALRTMDRLRMYLNQSLYLGLQDYEAHLAVYPEGSFYARHCDAHTDSHVRAVTTSLYLNPAWDAGDGGHLALYVDAHEPLLVPPLGGVLVTFLSQELEHEVLPARRDRLSWTGWYRRTS